MRRLWKDPKTIRIDCAKTHTQTSPFGSDTSEQARHGKNLTVSRSRDRCNRSLSDTKAYPHMQNTPQSLWQHFNESEYAKKAGRGCANTPSRVRAMLTNRSCIDRAAPRFARKCLCASKTPLQTHRKRRMKLSKHAFHRAFDAECKKRAPSNSRCNASTNLRSREHHASLEHTFQSTTLQITLHAYALTFSHCFRRRRGLGIGRNPHSRLRLLGASLPRTTSQTQY